MLDVSCFVSLFCFEQLVVLDASCFISLFCFEQLVVLGTMGGGVVILDHLGYTIQHRRPHVAHVVCVALVGDYWASAAKDRKVS